MSGERRRGPKDRFAIGMLRRAAGVTEGDAVLKGLDIWLAPYLTRDRDPPLEGCTDIVLAVCDHFEPFHGVEKREALARVARWAERFPEMAGRFRDHDGVGPRHSFFYPVEQYDAEIVEGIAAICRGTGSEAEIHLHHADDTPEGLREKLERGKSGLARHGLLSRDAAGRLVYGFIHGDWALDNSHPEGKNCGVSNELKVLKETGCYADFTMPSAPHPTQTRMINSLYYAKCGPGPKSHDRGLRVAAGEKSTTGLRGSEDHLLMVQGPLGLNWRWRKRGILPRVENGALTGVNPPTECRMELWLRLGIFVQARPNWRFIKLHTHGGIEANSEMLLGEAMARFHELAAGKYNDGSRFRLHYVSARELVNILHAAEAGEKGNPGDYRNYIYEAG